MARIFPNPPLNPIKLHILRGDAFPRYPPVFPILYVLEVSRVRGVMDGVEGILRNHIEEGETPVPVTLQEGHEAFIGARKGRNMDRRQPGGRMSNNSQVSEDRRRVRGIRKFFLSIHQERRTGAPQIT